MSLLNNIVENVVKSKKPEHKLTDLILDDDLINQINTCINKIKNYNRLYNDWEVNKIDKRPNSIIINFYGPPGTGKTMAAEALANSFNKSFIEVHYDELYSELMGKSGKNLNNFFQLAKKEDAVLFFDEADAILSKRSSINGSSDSDNNVTKTVMLKKLDTYDGIVIFATNYFTNYDKAFIRRIFDHIEFKLPNTNIRKSILEYMLSKNIPGRNLLDFTNLSENCNNLSGGEIKNAIIQTLAKVSEVNFLSQNDLIDAFNKIKSSKEIFDDD